MSILDELDEVHATLLADIRKQENYIYGRVHPVSAYSEGAEHALDTVRALAYEKPRRVTAVEELDALGRAATIIDNAGDVWTNDGDAEDQWGSVTAAEPYGGPQWCGSSNIALPATVVYEERR